MGNALRLGILPFIIATSAVLLVGLTLYTAFFGVFPDGIQRSAHLLLVLFLVFAMAFQATFDSTDTAQGGLKVNANRVLIIAALSGGAIATGHQLFKFDAINNRYGSITSFEIVLGGGGIFGTPLGVSATFVTGVVVLGTLLEKAGAGQVLMDFATALTGRMQGGPAKAAVVGSSLMGMISGTTVANVLTTGPISIPLMRKSGYRKEAA